MSIFRREPKPEITATEAIRLRVLSRLKHGHLARTATDHGIGLAQLEAFARSTGQLSVAQLKSLTKEFLMHAKYDAASDRFIDTSPPPKPAMIAPPPWVNPDPAIAQAHAAYLQALTAARPPDAQRTTPWGKVTPPLPKRPGFA